jgi:ethanolamine utilization microcompartment shell protein EutS
MSDTPYLVSRVTADGSSTPLAVAPSREAANEMIAKLEAADKVSSLTFYSRVPVEAAAPAADFRAVKSAALSLAFAD